MKYNSLILFILFFYGCSAVFSQAKFRFDIEQFFLEIERKEKNIKYFLAEAKIEIWRKDKRLNFDSYIYIEDDRRIRIEGLSPMLTTLFIFIATKDEYRFVDMERKRCYSGRLVDCDFKRFLGFSLSELSYCSVFIGIIPLIDYKRYNLIWDDSGYYILFLRNGKETEIIYVANNYKIIYASLIKGKEKRWEVWFKKYKRVKETFFPYKILLKSYKEETETNIRYKDIEINKRISERVWLLDCPWGNFFEKICP